MNINQSSRFLLPMLCGTSPLFFKKEGFKGCFIGDKNKHQWDGRLLLAYDYQPTRKWGEFEDRLAEVPAYIGSYYYEKPNDDILIVYGFSTNDFKDDFEKVMEGKYSEISPQNKLEIEKFWHYYNGSYFNSRVTKKHNEAKFYWHKIDKDPNEHCAKDEYWYKPKMEDELLDKDLYI